MMGYITTTLMLFAFGFNSPALAQFYKCTLDDGSVIFSDKRCANNAEKYEIKEAYKPDPSNLNIPQQQINTEYERISKPKSEYENDQQINVEPPSFAPEETAFKCTTASRKIYYSTTGCGSSNAPVMTPQGLGITVGRPFQDIQEITSKAEACSWATNISHNVGLSSQERRSARSLMGKVCK